MIAGWMPAEVTAADATAAARTVGKVAVTVQTVPGDRTAQFQRRADDDAQGALGPDHQRRQVESGDTFHAAVTEMDQAPVSEDEIDAQHGITDDAVLRAEQTARARGDVATDGGNLATRGIRGPPEPMCGEGRREVVVDDAGLDDREQVVSADLEDAVHPQGREDDLSGARVRAARESRSGSAGDDGRRGGCRDAQGRLDVGDALGVHDCERCAGRDLAGLVGASVFECGGRGVDTLTECSAQLRNDGGVVCCHASARRPATSPVAIATMAKPMPTHT